MSVPVWDAVRLLLPGSSVIHEFLRFKAGRIIGIPSVMLIAKSAPLRVVLPLGASITTLGRPVPFDANSSATCVFVGGFRLLHDYH